MTKEARVRAEQLASFLAEAMEILDKSKGIKNKISWTELRPARRKVLIAELSQHQSIKERVRTAIMIFFLVTILLGLVAMTIERYLSSLGMYTIWGGLFSVNVCLGIGYLVYKKLRENDIVKQYSDEQIVLANPSLARIPSSENTV